PLDQGGLDWPDAHVRVEGPAAHELERLFRAVWHKQTSRWFEASAPFGPAPGSAPVRIVGNHDLLKRFSIRVAYLNALRAAQSRVSIANSYFIPDWGIRHSLALAVRRSVDVRVLVPGRSDIRSVWYAMRANYAPLLARGVRIFEWQGPMMHAKAVVVDGRWCAVGSYNLDHRSLQHNLEANLQTTDPAFTAELEQRFALGLAGAVEITPTVWARRSWADRALENFFSAFDYFF
ncbi:MAG: cardiolipin synthase B, partial [Elusimicrobia bacterium CG11_big_fil_rev_8_21_14_0_20_64_6]